jgi:DNA polymerase-4
VGHRHQDRAKTHRGRDSAIVTSTPYKARSRGREVTYQQDLADWDDVRREVVALARRLATEIDDGGPPAIRVIVKVRFVPFFTETHSRKLPEPGVDPDAIEQAALEALDRFTSDRAVRLLGVRTELQR